VKRLAACLLALLVLTGCGGGSSKKATPTPTVEPKVAITTNWEAFFNSNGTVDAHVLLLENGPAFKDELTAVAKSPQAAGLSAKVVDVVVTGSSATVTYNLLAKDGSALLTKATGIAVLDTGTWKVSKATYCTLAKLQDPSGAHPGCA
jgi:hypothetical protein